MISTRETWRLMAYLAASTGFGAEEILEMSLDYLVQWATGVAEVENSIPRKMSRRKEG
jgi:hypothetical protein